MLTQTAPDDKTTWCRAGSSERSGQGHHLRHLTETARMCWLSLLWFIPFQGPHHPPQELSSVLSAYYAVVGRSQPSQVSLATSGYSAFLKDSLENRMFLSFSQRSNLNLEADIITHFSSSRILPPSPNPLHSLLP